MRRFDPDRVVVANPAGDVSAEAGGAAHRQEGKQTTGPRERVSGSDLIFSHLHISSAKTTTTGALPSSALK